MQRLFERLTHAQARRERLVQNRSSSIFDKTESAEVASVKEHLSRLLNTRRGSTVVDKGYGIPSLVVSPGNNSLSDRDALATLLRTVIEQYDTRLTDVSVNVASARPDDSSVGCEIRARIRPDLLQAGADNRVELQAQLMTDGTIVIQ